MPELTMTVKILLGSVWLSGSIGAYYIKYGRKSKIQIMSVASIERKYKRRNDESKKSIF